MNHFRSTDILLPADYEYTKWAVIACDQYTSQPEYWANVENLVGNAPSTLHMFFPEAKLSSIKKEDYEQYCNNMHWYLTDGILKEYPNSYVYVERTLQNGMIRQGILGMIDLDYYDYDPKPDTRIFATESTVLERVPPRIALRQEAPLEFSHTVIFCDDYRCQIIESVADIRDSLPLLYDFDLMFDGGHIKGYLLHGDHARNFEAMIAEYEKDNPYLVGDGNHSLVTAKLTYEAQKHEQTDLNRSKNPSRYAMVELENIHSPSMLFESIYRIADTLDPEGLIQELMALDSPNGTAITWLCGEKEGTVRLSHSEDELIVEVLQRFLDHRCERNGDMIDYIHGANTVRELSKRPGTVGFLYPDMEKTILFPYILSGRVMPKKTFSIGHAAEKRYYLEGRRIK